MAKRRETLEQTADHPDYDDRASSIGSDMIDDMPWVNMGEGRWSRIDDIITEAESSDVTGAYQSHHMIDSIDQKRENPIRGNAGKRSPPSIIVGFYIGLANSGSAFCDKSSGKWSHIQMNQSWLNEFGIKTSTVPTAISYDSADNYEFGNDAIIAFTRAASQKKYSLKEINQLSFRKSELGDTSSQVKSFLTHLFEKLKDNIGEEMKKYKLWLNEDVREIQWIVTNADFIKYDLPPEFLEKVVQSQNIQTIPEDVAAALWCAEIPIYELTNQRNPSMKIGNCFGVLDFESSYISLFEKKAGMSVDRLATQSLDFNLHDDYEKLFCEVFEMSNGVTINDYKQANPRDWFIMLKDIHTQIDGFKYQNNMPITLTLQYTFVKYFKNVETFSSKSVALTPDKKLVISPEYFRDIFDEYARKILLYLNGLNSTHHHPIAYLFLIGKAKLLAEPIEHSIREKTFPNVKIQDIKVPDDSRACALRGAVLYGCALASKKQTR